jgi:hypothetical protein
LENLLVDILQILSQQQSVVAVARIDWKSAKFARVRIKSFGMFASLFFAGLISTTISCRSCQIRLEICKTCNSENQKFLECLFVEFLQASSRQ